MQTKVETITPVKAQSILDRYWVQERQRKLSETTIEDYARSMRSGQWILTHQGIAISTEEELIDGQHRLWAVIRSGVTVPMMVTKGIPHNGSGSGIYTIDAIDRGKERGIGQQLQLRHDVQNGNLVAAVSRGVLWLCSASIKTMVGRFSVGNALRVMEIYGGEIRYAIEKRSRDHRVRNSFTIASAAFAMKACVPQIKDFYEKLTTGANISNGDPAMTCRRWLMNSSEKKGTLIEYRGVLTSAMKHVLAEKIQKIYDTEHGYNFFLEKQRQSVKKVLVSCGFQE